MKRLHVYRLTAFKKLAGEIARDLDMKHTHGLEQLSKAHGYVSYSDLLGQVRRNSEEAEGDCLETDFRRT